MTELPRTLAANPRLSTWVSLDVPGVVTVRVGKVELGQGILTALAQLAAAELDVGPGRVLMAAADTSSGPDEGATTGSLSVSVSGAALRQVCAEVRAVLLNAAAAKSGVDRDRLRVADGTIHDETGTVALTYWQLAEPGLLERDADGSATPRSLGPFPVLGISPPRLDLPDKIAGRPRFIHDLVLPGQLFGRVVRPPSPGARLADLSTVDLPGVVVVRDGSFLGAVAQREEDAVRAAAALAEAASWVERDCLPDLDDLPAWLRTADAEPIEVVADPPAEGVVREVSASYHRPYLAHASIAPSCGVAVWHGDELSVWSHSQHVHGLRRAIAAAMAIPAERIVVRHVEGAGCYGHNAADDAAFDAVLLARSVPGRPVQVVWSRADELAWAPLGPAMAVDVTAGLDAAGRIVSWRHDVFSPGHTSRPGYGGGNLGLLAATHRAGGQPLAPAVDPPPPVGGSTRNAVPYYDIPSRRVTGHRVLDMPIRTSALRSLGAYLNVFAIECLVDELAELAGRDPVEYRLAHLTDERARAVIARAAAASGWDGRRPGDSVGHGIAFARYKNAGGYCAVVAEVEAVHSVRVRRLTLAVDVGQVITPDGVRNQIEGGAIQSTSWTLFERVGFDRRAITSTDWESYPILRFPDAPTVHIELIDRPAEPSLGAGEAAQGPTAAAIANAVRDALGVGVRTLPLTPDNIVAALNA
ncbi:MAG TPA: molybdopterin cofactor-binding domain-containing protein [Actinophytocola sp.]|uniref:xanthine dehydrogenase family protein molybdopterin-binding subunit n=1 Tax=Actinophytocola sp. TaxID=1872138 RepID=UPI002DDC9D66|nr:molybdopterin cofactor-binding domain-containing protein [Actinophytocola sp.]HEV2783710.1 molybdopterin cofactor-binding domain-containing protein [Actinophytocola sp.]